MALVQNFNVNPYFDDYDEDKKFLRVLFRPGYAIQARELTQLQTIVQKQISRFGKHVFKNGSVVTGGEVSISTSVIYHKLKTTNTAGLDIDVNNFLGKTIGTSQSLTVNGSLGRVVAVAAATETDPPAIIVEYKTALSVNDGESLFTIDDDQFEARLIDVDSSGRAAVAYINEGVYFIDDFFVKVLPQTVILEKFSNTPTYRVGLTYEESIVTEAQDSSLLDPALNASNFQAPGATRYKVELTLEKRTLASTDDTKFIEIIRIENGTVTIRNNYPLYADLERTLARRTYDESGNYTVKPFTIYLRDHVPDNLANTPNTSLITAKLSPGKAYVRGFEVETVSPTNIALEKAREIESVQNYDIAANYGNYITIANTTGLFDVSTMGVLDLHNVSTSVINTASSGTYNATKIGTIRVRELEYVSAANTELPDTFKYRLYLSDPRFTTNNTIRNIQSLAVVNASTKLVASCNVDVTSQVSGNTFFSDTDFKSLVFRVPQSFVAFGMSDQDYRGRAVFKNQTVTTGSLTISTGTANNLFVGSGSLSDAQILEHFYVTANAATGVSEFTNSETISLVSATGRSITVSGGSATLDFNSSNTFSVDVIASVDFNTSSPKTKTLVTANTSNVNLTGTTVGNTTVNLTNGQIFISTPNKVPGNADSLLVSDIFKLEGQFEENYGYFDINVDGVNKKSSFKVIDSGNTAAPVTTADLTDDSKDITIRYILDDGQKDGYYDHGSIILRPGATPPLGQIMVLVNYFTHTGTGYFSVDSYNNASFGSDEDERYAKIPNFTNPITGEVYKLRDCIDFRPIRANASNTTPNFTLSGISIPKSGESLESDYSYYLPRTDRIVLREDRKFVAIKGISSLNPQTPAEPENAMSLYIVGINPYTFFPSDTRIRFVENKRYTMRDIGRLEKRIENLEYYTTLNTLEKSAQDLTVLDSSGLSRFKNGILVDSFRGHAVGDVKNIDYICSMNFQEGELRPSFYSNTYSFTANTSLTDAKVEAGTITSAQYTVVPVITQNVATSAIAVNPFTLSNYSGTLDFFPPGDFWIDTETRPDVLVNLEGENDAWAEIGKALEDTRAPGWGSQWNEWNDLVSGSDTAITTRNENRTEGFLDYRDTVQRTTTTTFYSRERTGTEKILVPERIVRSIGRRQVDLSVVPYVRSQWLIGIAKGLRPNQYHYLFTNQGDTNGTKYIEIPTIIWLYDVTGDFNDSYGIYETVTSSSGGTAKVLKQSGRSWSLNRSVIWLGDVRGTFAPGDTITGAVSGSTAKVDVTFWNNGNVTTAAASTITLASGSPYSNTYVDLPTVYGGVSWPSAGTISFSDAKEVNEWYRIRIIAGKGIGQERTITSYNGSTKVATITPNWTVTPDNTSRWSVGRPQSDDFGDMVGRWFLPNYGPTAYDNGFRTRTGSLFIRMSNNANNDPALINSFAEEYWYAQGVLNVVEDVSVSVRVPTIQNKVIYEKEDNYRSTSVVTESITGTTLIADRTPPPDPPPSSGGGDGSGGGGSGGKIICAEMARQGYFDPEVNEADQKFGRKLKRKYPKIYRGYAYWANTVVAWLRGKGPSLYLWKMNDDNETQRNITLHMTEVIARPWAEEMAYMEGVRDKGSIVGKFVLFVGFFMSVIVGLFNPDTSKPDSRLKGFTILGFMIIMYIIISLINSVTSVFDVLKNSFKNKLIRN
jgi:hypothetical protein